MEYHNFIILIASIFLLVGFLIIKVNDKEIKSFGSKFFIFSIALFVLGFSVPEKETFQEHLANLKHSSLVKVTSITNTNYLHKLYLKDGTIIKYKSLTFEEKFAPKYLANFCKDTIIYYPADKSKRVTEVIDDREHPNKSIDTDFYAKCVRKTTLIYKN